MNISVDYLIIGQGICGTLLCRELQKTNSSFLVIDDARPSTASKVASGIINPVTGRRLVTTWMIDELMPVAWNVYQALNSELGIDCIQEKSMIDFFPTPQMRFAFLSRIEENGKYLSLVEDPVDWSKFIMYDFGYGVISPCYLVDLQAILKTFRKSLNDKELIREEHFSSDELRIDKNGIQYKDLRASKVIFCDGVSGFNNPYFKMLPFAPNKGEALIIEIKDLPVTSLLKKGISIVPLSNDLFWVGSSYEWQYETDQPTTQFLDRTIGYLRSLLRLPFTLVDHWAAVRPATLERRPFIGLHPFHPHVGIFNGMGTKGCSLAPYYAAQFSRHLVYNESLSADVDIKRYKNILGRT